MKELTIEQKAERYDEMSKEVKDFFDGKQKMYSDVEQTLNHLFPELKESDDERIRKDIIRVLKGEISFVSEKENEKYIAWLEKQGTSYTKKDVDDAYLDGISVAKNEIEKQYEANYQIRKDIATFIFNYRGDLKDRAKWMDYLGIKLSFVKEKQKPNKKIEPKFHEGDFIVNDYCMGKVIEVTNDAYLLDTGQGIPFSCENSVHLWTIQDAKDGDLLVCDINKAEIGGDVEKLPNIVSTIFIFKNVVSSRDYIHSYCHLYDRHVLGVQNTMYYNSFVYNIHPATKEQRDLLIQKMREAGYEWDANKKELNKIKITDLVKDYNRLLSIKWSEYDSAKLQACIDSLQAKCLMGKVDTVLTNWLKSLKERISG